MTNPAVGWRVTSQTPSQDFSAGGVITNGVIISYESSQGVTGRLFVPDALMGDPDKVRELIAERVAQSAAIMELRG